MKQGCVARCSGHSKATKMSDLETRLRQQGVNQLLQSLGLFGAGDLDDALAGIGTRFTRYPACDLAHAAIGRELRTARQQSNHRREDDRVPHGLLPMP